MNIVLDPSSAASMVRGRLEYFDGEYTNAEDTVNIYLGSIFRGLEGRIVRVLRDTLAHEVIHAVLFSWGEGGTRAQHEWALERIGL
ncbi:MAG: hypothetical protein LN413_00375 [Candidatus Thermoplasmatota archaeon]|nr:hypothetical protein [Candidatus Thermoplasmatota archaeon]